jgi:hypothetical protein
MIKPRMLVAAALLTVPGLGCALTPPFKNAGPSTSREGVQVAVTRQRCEQVSEPDDYGWDLVTTELEVQVRNTTPAQLTVHRDAFRLLCPDGSALRTQTWGAADPVTVEAGTSGTFQLRMARGGAECTGEMVLDVDNALTLAGNPVKIAGVKFVPSRV